MERFPDGAWWVPLAALREPPNTDHLCASAAKAPASVLDRLDINRNEILNQVKASVRFKAPIAVVLPVAIYQ